MNLLESHIGLPLLERTRQGVSLTAAGSSIYQDAKALFQWSDEAIQRARQAQGVEQRTVRIGTSTLYPGMRLMELWGKVSDSWPMFRLKMVPFPDDPTLMFSDLGRRYDLFCGIYDSDLARHLCRFLPLGQDYFGLAMSRRHPLAERKHLSISDLSGQHLLIMPRGSSPSNDRVRIWLEQNASILLEDAPPHYDVETFNRCEELGWLLLTVGEWQDIHPSLVTVPLDVPESIPYGIIYSCKANVDTLRFLEIVGELAAL